MHIAFQIQYFKQVTAALALLLLAVSMTFTMAAVPSGALAQTPPQAPSPLHPAQNDNPRDTLQSFLRNTDALIALWRSNAPVREQRLFLRAAIESFDFENSPYAASTSEQIERILLAREIIARTTLPPASAIPGPDEVARDGLTAWTLPGTDLRMKRVGAGRDEGDFKFDTVTIGELELDYRRAKELPRLDGQADFYEEYLQRPGAHGITTDTIATRLQSAGTSSPRETLEAFMFNVNAAYEIAMAAEQALDAVPPRMTIEDARALQAIADDHLYQATSVFDLSEVPPILRKDTGVEATLLLKEILDRIPLPRLDAVPDAGDLTNLEPGQGYRWRVPGTRIEIEKMLTGPNAGSFLFDSATVSGLQESYKALKDLPYRSESALTLSDFRSSSVSPGFYEFYISTPGYLVPSTHMIGELLEHLPA